MPRTTLATLFSLLALVGALVAPGASVAGAGSAPKVVVIVGPAGSMTASYQTDADAAAAAALQYTPNVIKVYTPNATWEAVKAAIQGASVVIYMGHGNGFPSPYRTTPWPLSQNGLGLNPTAGDDNSTTRYYGESYLASDVRLAANAVVFLHHLCYASGNSEPGRGEPTLAVAQQRIDNYGAGWLQTGARAVLADAHYGAAYYVNALFTTSQTIDAVWRGAPGAQGNYLAFSSSRTPGALGQLDPETPTSGLYRSLIGDPTLSTSAITGGAGVTGALFGAPTSGDPATVDGTALQVLTVDAGDGVFSPNGDGRSDVFSLVGTLSRDATWSVTFTDPAGVPVAQVNGSGSTFAATWDGFVAGGRAPDGIYRYTITASDASGNASASRSGAVRLDDTVPSLAPPTASGLAATTFSPNGDGIADRISTDVVMSEAGFVDVAIVSVFGQPVRSFTVATAPGRVRVTWDGRTDAGISVPDGQYTMTLTPRDAAGTVGAALTWPVAVYTAVTALPRSPSPFFPQDPNATGPTATTLGFTLAAPATITWTISDRAGRTVVTQYRAASLAPDAYSFAWNGRDAAGNIVAPGTYYSNVSAGNGTLALRTRAPFVVDAFAISVSDTTPARGQRITITAISAEALGASPRLTIAQPGTTARVVTMTPSGPGYRATVTLRRTTRTGTLVLTVSGADLAGVANRSRLVLRLY